MQRLSLAATAATFLALGSLNTLPASAALLNFNFTTQSGGTGSFNLDTAAPPDSQPATLSDSTGAVYATGYNYLSAISNFSFSSPTTNFNNLTGDVTVYPSLPFGFSFSSGVYSLIVSPSGCGNYQSSFCSLQLDLVYSGNSSELPVLDANPSAYPIAGDIASIDTKSGAVLSSDTITNFKATSVPESVSVLSIVAFGIGSASWLLKRNL